jgi:nitrate reductase gamma subunit
MYSFNTLAFLVFPYLALTIFVLGHAYRYYTDLSHWSSRSSELLDKTGLRYGILIFHWGIIVTFFGHFAGLLTPQWLLDRVGISAKMHDAASLSVGMVVGTLALVGLIVLLFRRLTSPRIRATSSVNDVVVLGLLLIVVGLGSFNAFFRRYDVLHTIAPWIRSIITFSPDPELVRSVPWSYKLHILAALTVLAYSPFSRLVHIWSVPVQYPFRRYILFRRRVAGFS